MESRADRGSLSEFLRSRRDALVPNDLESQTGRRRVSGLRREELAARAKVSVPYYARLEQGIARHASPAVLDSLAEAMSLTDDERRHLHNLVGDGRLVPELPRVEQVCAPIAQLLPSLDGTPAVVLGRSMDYLTWNRLGHALVADHLDPRSVEDADTRPNAARLAFLDLKISNRYPDRDRKMRAVVGHLRLTAGKYPADARLNALVADLSEASTCFRSLWADHSVAACDGASYVLNHPVVGPIEIDQQSFSPLIAEDQTLVTFTAATSGAGAVLDRLRRPCRTPG